MLPPSDPIVEVYRCSADSRYLASVIMAKGALVELGALQVDSRLAGFVRDGAREALLRPANELLRMSPFLARPLRRLLTDGRVQKSELVAIAVGLLDTWPVLSDSLVGPQSRCPAELDGILLPTADLRLRALANGGAALEAATASVSLYSHSVRLFVKAEPNLFDPEYVDEISLSCDTDFSATLARAIQVAAASDFATRQDLLSDLRWVVPLHAAPVGMHRSFSSSRLPGTVFLSRTSDVFRTAEAMVHEHGHLVLNGVMDYVALINDHERLVYSPWRPDARPVAGLLHAVFVFSVVVEFLRSLRERCDETGLNVSRPMLDERIGLISERIRLALRQFQEGMLTTAGHELLERLTQRTRPMLEETAREGHPLLRRHIEEWRRLHPHLAAHS